jgi:hypothetical protein
MAEDTDNIHDFEAKETSLKIPMGWQVLFWGLIIWGIYYVATYTPLFSGWSQESAYQRSVGK